MSFWKIKLRLVLIVKVEQIVYRRSRNLSLFNLDVGGCYSLIIIITVVASATGFMFV